ncbi:hypothetical protein C0992_002689 [Termitomyces sp. T32_za158]|nr:hypothetical protein C0992_002689 [Termitomyces sp. T32_za158]
MASLPGEILKGDHTFKLIKYLGRLMGEPTHDAMYTVVNEWEEARSQALTLTKSLAYVSELYEDIAEGLKEHGHLPTAFMYTDNASGELAFHESTIQSLTTNVVHKELDSYMHFLTLKLPADLLVVYYDSFDLIDSACAALLSSKPDDGSHLVIGFDIEYEVETTGQGGPGANPRAQVGKLDVIQIATEETIYIFKITQFQMAASVPPCLRSVLTSPQILKFGRGVFLDLKRISEAWSISALNALLTDSTACAVDLGAFGKLKGKISDSSASLAALSAATCLDSLHFNLNQPQIKSESEDKYPIDNGIDDAIQNFDLNTLDHDNNNPIQDPPSSGGIHILLQRTFGALCTSPELADAILALIQHRQNINVGSFNRTGKKYRGHFDSWLIDEIAELTVELDMTPSFSMPNILSTRIATKESSGINKVPKAMTISYGMYRIEKPLQEGTPYYHNVPVHLLTHLSTTSTSVYQYLQERQQTAHAVTPIHTPEEYALFNELLKTDGFVIQTARAVNAKQVAKTINFNKFAFQWNNMVHIQPESKIFYKIPQQLKRHHKVWAAYQQKKLPSQIVCKYGNQSQMSSIIQTENLVYFLQ